jgi:hypothetical protein
VEVLQPSEQYILSIEQLLGWTTRPPRSPQEKIVKVRISDLLQEAMSSLNQR